LRAKKDIKFSQKSACQKQDNLIFVSFAFTIIVYNILKSVFYYIKLHTLRLSMKKIRFHLLGVLLLTFALLTGTVVIASTQFSYADERASIHFTYKGKSYHYIDELIAAPDHIVAEDIQLRKINAPLSEKMKLVEKVLTMDTDFKKAILVAFPLLQGVTDKITEEVNALPVDSTITFRPNAKPMFLVNPEKNGYEVVDDTLYRDIFMHLKQGKKTPLAIKPKILSPEVTAFENMKLTQLRAKFSTSYEKSSADRKHNIFLAMQKINGTVLGTGEEFSFNKTVGARSEKNGFKTGKIILNGEYVNGIGGGVCQASTTLYNAALRADMHILHARNHSLAASYVPLSFDAMVNSGTSDLSFKNTGNTPVFIKATANDSTVEVEFYGLKLPYKITTESVTILTEPPPEDKEIIDVDYQYFTRDTATGTRKRIVQGRGKVKSEGYLLYHDFAGTLIKRELIRKDTYLSMQGTVVIAPQRAPEYEPKEEENSWGFGNNPNGKPKNPSPFPPFFSEGYSFFKKPIAGSA